MQPVAVGAIERNEVLRDRIGRGRVHMSLHDAKELEEGDRGEEAIRAAHRLVEELLIIQIHWIYIQSF